MMILDRIKEELKLAKNKLNATSCTFYVRDPFWSHDLRLIAMPGVQFTEPMHGFSFPPHSKKVVAEGEIEIFSSDTQSEERLREKTESSLEGIAQNKSFLFGDFVQREGIKSSARLLHKVDGRVEAVLFINYTETKEFDETLKEDIRDLLNQLAEHLPTLGDELRKSETDALIQAIRMFPPSSTDSPRISEWDQPLKDSLDTLLGVIMDALELSLDETFGTIHRYERQTKTLQLEAFQGNVENRELAESLSVLTGQGVISWVAIRRKALLIPDLEDSVFRENIYVSISKGVRSEVAIPISDGKDLLGVLNLESLRPNAFSPGCVRSLWFAVNRAAVAYRLSQQQNINTRLKNLSDGLLELCAEFVIDVGKEENFSLNKLAKLATTHLEASHCDIWRYDERKSAFEKIGISYDDFTPIPPRSGGWSEFIRQTGWWTLINKIQTVTDFAVTYWNGKTWDKHSPPQNPPVEINSSVVERDVKSILGIPITVSGQCIGVAWLEYKSDFETHPEDELLKLASGFAANAGILIELSRVDFVDKRAVQRIGEELSENHLASGGLNLNGFPWIGGFVKSEPFPSSTIGGDFYAIREIDSHTAGVLLGDGQGHAITGTINMLPMLSVFEAFWKESRAATHIMDKIMSISRKLGVKGTAIYCVFSIISGRLWLSVTTSAHDSVIIFPKKEGGMALIPEKDSPRAGGLLGVPYIDSPPAEEHRELFSGDLIVIYTDGLKAQDKDEDITGDIGAICFKHKNNDPKVIAEAIFEDALARNKGKFKDDATVLVIRVK